MRSLFHGWNSSYDLPPFLHQEQLSRAPMYWFPKAESYIELLKSPRRRKKDTLRVVDGQTKIEDYVFQQFNRQRNMNMDNVIYMARKLQLWRPEEIGDEHHEPWIAKNRNFSLSPQRFRKSLLSGPYARRTKDHQFNFHMLSDANRHNNEDLLKPS